VPFWLARTRRVKSAVAGRVPRHPYRQREVHPTTAANETAARPKTALLRVVGITCAVTAAVTAASYLAPPEYAATAVGLAFLAATWLLVLRKDSADVRGHGLALGGLLLPEEVEWRSLARDALVALAWALGAFAVITIPFAIGYVKWFHPKHAFDLRAALPSPEQALAQLLVIALPEEAFFRGWLQTELDRFLPRKITIATLPLGPSILVTSAVFALGHFLTIPSPARLAVFFPSLLFGSLRARTRGIGAGVVFHAACNLLSASLAHGFGLVHP
jgi:membrane protease YdiL (CAAX protease family)